MSIRLRLTLIYTIILALISILLSLSVYFGQTEGILHLIRVKLVDQAQLIAQSPTFNSTISEPPIANAPKRLQNLSWFDTYYVQVRSLDGTIIEQSDNLQDITLPLSDEAIQAVQNGEAWFDMVSIDGERLAVYNRLFEGSDGDPKILQVAQSLTFIDELRVIQRIVLIIINTVIAIAGFGIGWLMAGFALRPIHRITQTAQEIGAERDFDRRVDHPGPNDEIGQLATTFNGMLTELQDAFVQVEQSLQAQRRFVADASHELRTPLTTLRGNIGLLRRKPPISDEDRDDVLQDMVDETERLMRLTNDLLVLARADAKRSLKNETIPIKPLLVDTTDQMKFLAPDRIVACASCPDVDIKGDKDALRQILLILLDNAIKYTPPDATITLSSEIVDGKVDISIQDDGPGIEPERLLHIFDRFYRGDDARTEGGTGLGLSIAKELTEAQNGTIAVKSEPRQGTVFIVTFPKASI